MTIYCVYSGGDGTSGAVAGSVPTSGEWATAYQSLLACLTAITEAAGDIIFVAHDHANLTTANTTISPAAFIYIISIDRANTTTATPLAGALEHCNGNYNMSIGGSGYAYGVTFKAGSGGSQASASINIAIQTSNDGNWILDNCAAFLNVTNATPITIGASRLTSKHLVTLRNFSVRFGATTQYLRFSGSQTINMINCTVDAAGSTPAALFAFGGEGAAAANMSACDFSKSTALVNLAGLNSPASLRMANCIVPSTITTGTHPGPGSNTLELFACSTASDDNIYQYYYNDGSTTITHNTGVYKTTGGATFKTADGSSVPMSLMMVTTSSANKVLPGVSPWFNVEVTSTGSKTFTIDIANTTAALKDNEAWIEVEYYGNTAHPMSSNAISAPAVSGTQLLDVLVAGSNMTDTSEAWTGITGEITHAVAKTVTVNQQGFARARLVLAKPSATIYVDPQVIVS